MLRLFFMMLRPPSPSALFPYTTLFRSSYVQQLCFSITKYRLDRLAIRVLFSADDLRLEGERCWKLGLIVSELLTNVARHARSEEHTSELQSLTNLVCRLLLEKKNSRRI